MCGIICFLFRSRWNFRLGVLPKTGSCSSTRERVVSYVLLNEVSIKEKMDRAGGRIKHFRTVFCFRNEEDVARLSIPTWDQDDSNIETAMAELSFKDEGNQETGAAAVEENQQETEPSVVEGNQETAAATVEENEEEEPAPVEEKQETEPAVVEGNQEPEPAPVEEKKEAPTVPVHFIFT